MLDYAAMTTLVTERLRSSGTADYSVAEIDNSIVFALAEISRYQPNMVNWTFNLEGRKGTASSTSADNLIDTTKGSFLASDATDEKVIHNTTDYTWAVVLSYSSTSQIGLSSDIMAVNENYEIYNKRCTNHRQIYIGDIPNSYRVASVEYPIGTRRNFTQEGDILEVDVDAVPDTNSNTAKVNSLANSEVLVRFGIPHSLPNLTDVSATFAATAAAADTTISATALQGSGTIDVGTQFNIENHRTTYVVSSSATIASSAATIPFYPPLESAVPDTAWVISIKQSTLHPHLEDIAADLAAGQAASDRAVKFANTVAIGGGRVINNYLGWGQRTIDEAKRKLMKSIPARTKRKYPSD